MCVFLNDYNNGVLKSIPEYSINISIYLSICLSMWPYVFMYYKLIALFTSSNYLYGEIIPNCKAFDTKSQRRHLN